MSQVEAAIQESTEALNNPDSLADDGDIDADIAELEAELEADEEDDWEYLLDPAVDMTNKCKDKCFIAKLFETSALGQFDIMQLE